MDGENQTNLASEIGNANSDIGHVVGTSAGGNSGVASGNTCNNSNKAQGATTSANPVGDPFDVDYVAHEIGHQFSRRNEICRSITGNILMFDDEIAVRLEFIEIFIAAFGIP